MPEITSVETIRTKLREFEERVEGAITAARALARIKADAAKLLTDIQEISTKSEKTLQKAEGVQLQFQRMQSEWGSLKDLLEKAQADSKEVGKLLRSEVDLAIQSLGEKVTEAELRLRANNKASLEEQADVLNRLDTNIQANAEVAARAQSEVAKTAVRLDQLIAKVRDDLQAEIQRKLASAEELIESEAQRVESFIRSEQVNLRETVENKTQNHERLMGQEMAGFRTEIQHFLGQHQQGIDRQLTEFLNKQNAMVQNLSQQIDSFNRASQAQSVELAATNTKVAELSSLFSAYKAASASELATLTAEVKGLKSLLSDAQTGLRSQADSIVRIDSSSRENAARLSETIERLKQLPLVGNKFK